MTENDLITTLSTVSYINYGPFTSYAPTYDSSFANVSKEDSDLIYSSYGEESSLQGSDRYVQYGHELHKLRGIHTKRHLRHSWPITFQMFLFFTEVIQSGGAQLWTGPQPDFNPSILTLWFHLLSVVYNYLLLLWATAEGHSSRLGFAFKALPGVCLSCACNYLSFCIQAEHYRMFYVQN